MRSNARRANALLHAAMVFAALCACVPNRAVLAGAIGGWAPACRCGCKFRVEVFGASGFSGSQFTAGYPQIRDSVSPEFPSIALKRSTGVSTICQRDATRLRDGQIPGTDVRTEK